MINPANTTGTVDTTIVPNWWDTCSVEECRRSFRTALKAPKPDNSQILYHWIKYALISILRGTPRAAVAILPALLDRLEKNGSVLSCTGDQLPNVIVAKTLFRAAVTLAEFPEIPLEAVLRVAPAANSFCALCSDTTAAAALNVALAPRLGRIKETSADIDSLERAWEQENTQDPPLCRAATGEIIVEFLIAAGEVDRAIKFAVPAAEERPCIAPCFLFPQGLLAGMLEPLQRAGMVVRARNWHDRLVMVAPVSKMWLRHSGARCAYLSLAGDQNAADEIREQCDGLAGDKDISPWQRMHYHCFAARSIQLAREAGYGISATEEAHHQQEAKSLEANFERRNRQLSSTDSEGESGIGNLEKH